MMKPIYLALGCLLLLTACGDATEATNKAATDEDGKTEETSNEAKDKQLFGWVDNLNIRAKPSTTGEVVATVQPTTPLMPTGEESGVKESIVLRGKLYTESWIAVTTPDDQQGWAFGGAVKQKDEQKGNPPISPTIIAFDHFGTYDLTKWKEVSKKKGDDEGDFDTMETVYSLNGESLEVYEYDGEYGYGYTYKHLNAEGEVLKERAFNFSNDIREITEEVTIHNGEDQLVYKRSQPSPLTSYQLNSRPIMVNGLWSNNAEKK